MHVQNAVKARLERLTALTDLSVLCGRGTATVPAPQLDVGCVSRLTTLETLALEGVRGVGAVTERLEPLVRLTALRLQGTENDSDMMREQGGYLLPFTGLQCLDLDVEFHVAGAGDSAGVGWRGGRAVSSSEGSLSESQAEEGGSEAGSESDALAEEVWLGVWGALRELPLQLGARVRVRIARSTANAP